LEGTCVVGVAIGFAVLFCCLGSVPPSVNESHYLPKSKHAWDASFASGGDLFLESVNSHWLASAATGLTARVLELSSVAWIGRIVSWWMMSLAWVQLCRAVQISNFLRPFGLLAWFLWNHYGNWAGEWFVGGFEAKSIAYPCVLLGISAILRNQWRSGWLWWGTAVAWHPVVGGWAGLSILMLWFLHPHRWMRWTQQWPALCFASLIGLIGIVPALSGLGGSDREGLISAAQVHTYFRLAHHLSPQTFATERNLAAFLSLGILIVVTIVAARKRPEFATGSVAGQLLIIAWTAVFFSLMGWVLDFATGWGLRHDLAARLLRFYFFRWSDVAVPLVVTILLLKWISVLNIEKRDVQNRTGRSMGSYVVLAFIVGMSVLGVLHWRQLQLMEVPPADKFMMKSVGPIAVHTEVEPNRNIMDDGIHRSDVEKWSRMRPLPPRYEDWLAVCQWIKENTPEDSLWLTPRYQQTFKWYAGRAEVVNWKDVPQDNASVIEWYRRIERCKPPRNHNGTLRGWTTDELIELAREYRFQWVLIDRTYQEAPPLMECKYPILMDNRSFAVFYISGSSEESVDGNLR